MRDTTDDADLAQKVSLLTNEHSKNAVPQITFSGEREASHAESRPLAMSKLLSLPYFKIIYSMCQLRIQPRGMDRRVPESEFVPAT